MPLTVYIAAATRFRQPIAYQRSLFAAGVSNMNTYKNFPIKETHRKIFIV